MAIQGSEIVIHLKGDVSDFQNRLKTAQGSVNSFVQEADKTFIRFNQNASQSIIDALNADTEALKQQRSQFATNSREYQNYSNLIKQNARAIETIAKDESRIIRQVSNETAEYVRQQVSIVQQEEQRASQAAQQGNVMVARRAREAADQARQNIANAIQNLTSQANRSDQIVQQVFNNVTESNRRAIEGTVQLAQQSVNSIAGVYQQLAQHEQSAMASLNSARQARLGTRQELTTVDGQLVGRTDTLRYGVAQQERVRYSIGEDGSEIEDSRTLTTDMQTQRQAAADLFKALQELAGGYSKLETELQKLSQQKGEAGFAEYRTEVNETTVSIRELAEVAASVRDNGVAPKGSGFTLDTAIQQAELMLNRFREMKAQIAETSNTTENLAMTVEKADSKVLDINNKFSSLSGSMQQVAQSGKYPADTFAQLIQETESLKTRASELQQQYQNNQITDREYTDGIQALIDRQKELSTQFAETKVSAEQLPMTIEQAQQAATTMSGSFSNLLSNIDRAENKLGTEAFSGIREGITNAVSDLSSLNAAFESGQISEQTYSAGIVDIGKRLAQLKADFNGAKQGADELAMPLSQADKYAVSLGRSFASLSNSIKKAESSSKTIPGTYDKISSQVEKVANSSKKLQEAHANGALTDAQYTRAMAALVQKLNDLSIAYSTTQATSEKMRMSLDNAQESSITLGQKFTELSEKVKEASSGFVAGTFDALNKSIGNAKLNLESLVTGFQNGTINEQQFATSIQALDIVFKMLNSTFVETKANGEKLTMTQSEAQKEAKNLAKGFAQLQSNINRLKESYVTGTFTEVESSVNRNREALDKLNKEYEEGKITLKDYGKELKKIRVGYDDVSTEFETTKADGTKTPTGDSFLKNMGKYARWYFGGNLITGAKRQFQEAFTEMKNVDAELIQVKKVTDASSESLKKMGDNAYDVGKKYGVAASEYLNAVAAFSRAGMKDQAEELAELSVKAALVGDMAQDSATAMFLAIQKSYDSTSEELGRILDGLNELDNKHATTIENITEGIGKVTSIAATAHTGIDELAAAIGTITAVTQRSGTEAATALRALFLNIIGDTKTEIEEGETATVESINNIKDALREYAPEVVKYAEKTKTVINPMEAIRALAKAYNDQKISEEKLMEILSGIGGKLRTSQLSALVMNWKEYEEQLIHFNDSFNSADAEVSNALDSWEKKLQILSNTWTEFIARSVETDFIKSAIDRITNVVNLLGDLRNALTIVMGVLLVVRGQKIAKGIEGIWKQLVKLKNHTLTAASAMSALQIAVSALTVAFTAYVMISNAITQKLEKQYEESKKLSEATQKNVDDITTLWGTYKRAADGSAEHKQASEELATALGVELSAVKSLNEQYDIYIGKTKEIAQKNKTAAYAAQVDAGKLLTDAWNKLSLQNNREINALLMKKLPDSASKIIENALRKGIIKTQRGRTGSATVLTALSDRPEDIKAFLDVLNQVRDTVFSLASAGKEGMSDSVFDEAWWDDLTSHANAFKDVLNQYDIEYDKWLRAKVIDDFYTAVSNGALKSTAAAGKYLQAVERNLDYTRDQKDLIHQLTMEMLFGVSATEDFAESTDVASDALDETASKADKAASAVERFQDALKEKNTDGLESYGDLFDQVYEAAKKGQYGSVVFQEGMKAILSPEKYKEFADKEDWEGMFDYVGNLMTKKGGAFDLEAAPVRTFEWLASIGEKAKVAGKDVWRIADGVLEISKNAKGNWQFQLFNDGKDAETVEDVTNAIHKLNEETGVSAEYWHDFFLATSLYNPGQYDIFKDSKEQFFSEVKTGFKLDGENIDVDGIVSTLTPGIESAFKNGYTNAMDAGADGDTALSRGVQAAIEYAARNADLSDTEIQEGISGVIEGALKETMGDAFTKEYGDAIAAVVGSYNTWKDGEGQLTQVLASVFSDPAKWLATAPLEYTLQPPVEKAMDTAAKAAVGEKADVWTQFESACESAIKTAVKNGFNIDDPEIQEKMFGIMSGKGKALGLDSEEVDAYTKARLEKAVEFAAKLNKKIGLAGVGKDQMESVIAQRKAFLETLKDTGSGGGETGFMDLAVEQFRAEQKEKLYQSMFGSPESLKKYILDAAWKAVYDFNHSALGDNAEAVEAISGAWYDINDALGYIYENWDDISKKIDSSNPVVRGIMDLIQKGDISSASILGSAKDTTAQYGEQHKLLVIIEQLLLGIKDLSGSMDIDTPDGAGSEAEDSVGALADSINSLPAANIEADTSGLESAKEAAEETGAAVETIPDEKSVEVPTDSLEAATSAANDVTSAINAIPSSKTVTITVKVKGGGAGIKAPVGAAGTGGIGSTQIPAQATGTDYFEGGQVLVNDEPGGHNPELILDQGDAFIANHGDPAIVKLSRGARIYNADDTREIFEGGGVITKYPRYLKGTYDVTPTEDGGGGGKRKRDRSGHSHDDDKDENEWFDLLKEYIEELLEDAEAALDAQKEAITAQILALRHQQEVAEKANELEEKRLAMVKAENDLIDAQHERTVRYFNAATGQWEWMADQRAVLDAQEALAEAQKDYLDAQYDYLEDLWKKLEDEISDFLEEKQDIDIAQVLRELQGSEAGSTLGSVEDLIEAIQEFTKNPKKGKKIKKISKVYDSGGIASGVGLMPKGTIEDEVVLDSTIAGRILSPKTSGELSAFTNNLTALLDMASTHTATPQSMLNKLSNVTNNSGGNTFINGVQIGSDMMSRPLSDVLSVLSIYANA